MFNRVVSIFVMAVVLGMEAYAEVVPQDLGSIRVNTPMYTAEGIDNIVSNVVAGIEKDNITDGTNTIDATRNVYGMVGVGEGWELVSGKRITISPEWVDPEWVDSKYVASIEVSGWYVPTDTSASPSGLQFLSGDYNAREVTGVVEGPTYDVTTGGTVYLVSTNTWRRTHTEVKLIGRLALTNDIQVGAVPLVEDASGEKTAVTVGSRKSDGAVGASSLANGLSVTASGDYSHAEGSNTTASVFYSHAEGGNTTASGAYSHAEGGYTTASGNFSHAEGNGTTASGNFSHAEGRGTTAGGYGSHAEGFKAQTKPKDDYAFSWNGDGTREDPYASHGAGTFNINPVGGAGGLYICEQTLPSVILDVAADKTNVYTKSEVDAKGYVTASVTNGFLRTEQDPVFTVWTNGMYVAAGRGAKADDTGATALGYGAIVNNKYGVAVGASSVVQGDYAIALGVCSTASGEYDTALGQRITINGPYGAAVGAYSSVIGSHGAALGPYSYASSWSTALGNNSYAPSKSFGTTYDPEHFYFTSSNDTTTASKRGVTKKSLQAYLDERVATNAIAKVATSGAYSDLTGTPTKVSAFENDAGYATAADLGGYLPLTGGMLTGDLTVNGVVYGRMLVSEGEIAFADAGSGTVGIVGGGGSLEFFSRSDPLNPKESALVPDGSKVMTETLTNEKLGGYATKADVAAKADKAALEAHVADTNNPHAVTAAQVGALPLSGGTVRGNLMLGVGSGGRSPTLEVSGVSSGGINLNAEYGGKITVGDGSNGGGQIVLDDSSVPGGTDAEVTIGTVKVRATLAAKQDKLTKDSAPTVGALLLMGDRVSNGVSIDATPGGAYGALAVKGADNRTSILTPDGGPVLTQTLGDARYAPADALASLVPESIGKTVDGAKWSLSADLVSTKTTTAAGEASCTLTTQFGTASLSKIQDRLFSGVLDGIGNVAVWWDGSAWNWGTYPVPSDPTSMQSVSTDPSSDANATSLSFSDGSKATISLGAGTEVVETSHLATAEAVAAAYVPVTRTVNGKPLSADVVLTAADVGAVGSETDPLFSAWKDATNVLIGAGASTITPVSPFVNNSVAIGPGAKTVPFYGSDGKYKDSAAVAIGHGAEAHGYGVAIGKGAVSTGDDVVLGSESTTGLTVFADPGSFVFRYPESGTYVGKTLKSFLDLYWKKTDWLVGVPRIEIVPDGLVKCPDYMGTDGVSVCFSADGNDIDDTTSRLYPDGSNVATEKTVRSVIDTQPATVNSGRLYSFRPSASSGAIAIVPAFEAGLKGTAEAFLDFSAAAPAVSFGGAGMTVLYADGSLKPAALAVSGLYVVELKWFSTAASGTTQKYLIVNAYRVSEDAS